MSLNICVNFRDLNCNTCAEIFDRFILSINIKLAINNNLRLLYKQCLIHRNSTKHFNNTTPVLYSIDSIRSHING